MNPWFVWNGQNSFSKGLWISKLPKITRPEERIAHVTIPGRAGELTLTEGEEVYNAYKKEIVVTCPNEHFSESLLHWLRGDGELIICTEPQFVYRARIAAAVEFSRVGNSLMQATIAFWCQPFKYSVHPQDDQLTLFSGAITENEVSATATATVYNPGNAASRPKLEVGKWGGTTLAIGDTQMAFEHLPEMVVIDCDAEIIKSKAIRYVDTKYYYRGDYATYWGETYENGLYRFTTEGTGSQTEWEYVGEWTDDFWYVWPGKWTGEFLRIPPGSNTFTLTVNSDAVDPIVIDPNWRWV